MKHLLALVSGLIFGAGLTVSQMVDPQKVLNFLDISGNWDPSLIFVMGAGLAVFGLAYFLVIKNRKTAIFGAAITLSNPAGINRPLLIGAAIFGLGWGISGICPGPAVANISGGDPKIAVFVVMMLVGMKASDFLKKRKL
jgi:uncharacterized membrane protein YedE/YeeE